MSFTNISLEWNHFCKFGTVVYKEDFFEINLNLDQEEMAFKDIYYL